MQEQWQGEDIRKGCLPRPILWENNGRDVGVVGLIGAVGIALMKRNISPHHW